jgi:DNA repair protein RecN (Recombination protein N)
MLRLLEIRDILTVERLELAFQPGLNVLTGETGAGKSILLDALGLALGWGDRADLTRPGAERGEVTAQFELGPDHPARTLLAEAGLPADDALWLRRAITSDGRRTAWVNDRRASAALLRGLADSLVELHGQQDAHGLLDPARHRAMLDAFAGAAAERAATRQAWREWRDARAECDAARAEQEAAQRDAAFLRHAAAELAALAPQAGEDGALDAQRRRMQGASRIAEDVARAHAALGPEGAGGRAADALRWLDGAAMAAEGTLDDPIAALGRALDALGEAEQGIEAALGALAFDPAELEAVEERLFAIRALARKHRVAPDALAPLADEIGARLDALEDGAAGLVAREEAVRAAEARWQAASAALSARRAEAARALEDAMQAELAPLRLDRARFRVALSEAPPGPSGRDAVAFMAATNPDLPEGPLDRIASGGELSRFMLALKVCLRNANPGATLIFDEIDRGVGGATADAVGRRLADLAASAQVLVVTHAPQVAARADHHWHVAKVEANGQTTTRVGMLDADARRDEIARMLAGETVTDAARAAAAALLSG